MQVYCEVIMNGWLDSLNVSDVAKQLLHLEYNGLDASFHVRSDPNVIAIYRQLGKEFDGRHTITEL